MLVMYLALDRNNIYQFKDMHKKETAWATSIRVGGVQQNEVRKTLTQEPPQQ